MNRHAAILMLLLPIASAAQAKLDDGTRNAVAIFANRVATQVHPSMAALQTPQNYEATRPKESSRSASTQLPLGYENWKTANSLYPACEQLGHIAYIAMEKHQAGQDMEPLYRGIERGLLPDAQEVARAVVSKSQEFEVSKKEYLAKENTLRIRTVYEVVRDVMAKPKELDAEKLRALREEIASLYSLSFSQACASLSVRAAPKPTVADRMAFAKEMEAGRTAIEGDIQRKLRPSRCSYARFFAGHALKSRMLGVSQESMYAKVFEMGPQQLHLLGIVKVAYERPLDPSAKADEVAAEFGERVHGLCMAEDAFLAPLEY